MQDKIGQQIKTKHNIQKHNNNYVNFPFKLSMEQKVAKNSSNNKQVIIISEKQRPDVYIHFRVDCGGWDAWLGKCGGGYL